jgi:hypothetical protein
MTSVASTNAPVSKPQAAPPIRADSTSLATSGALLAKIHRELEAESLPPDSFGVLDFCSVTFGRGQRARSAWGATNTSNSSASPQASHDRGEIGLPAERSAPVNAIARLCPAESQDPSQISDKWYTMADVGGRAVVHVRSSATAHGR